MAGYKTYTVKILLEDGSDLMQRIQKSADTRGISFQEALEEAVQIGSWRHIADNLDFVNRANYSPVLQ